MEAKAGACVSGRHRWDKEERRSAPRALYPVYIQRCQNCGRIRVIEYTKRGNHIAGYESPT